VSYATGCVAQKAGKNASKTVCHLTEIAPGDAPRSPSPRADKGMDVICDGTLEGRHFIFPAGHDLLAID